MAKNWSAEDYDMTQAEIAEELGTSQQNVNDAQVSAMRKAKKLFSDIFTLEEIRSYLRYCERK